MKKIQRLKMCLEVAAQNLGLNYGQFRRARGIQDFLIDGCSESDTPQQIAVSALTQLCDPADEQRKMDGAVYIAVVRFLDQTLLPQETPAEIARIRDLKTIMESSGSEDEIKRWIDSWYR